ncbi:MAG: ATP-binding protein [Planctomycetaceae bacterium]|nr:ATP-binding protein [Planctomycetaceae bacterium]
MADRQRHIPFKVDIAGIIDIMGSSLYSRIDTPIRELLQNAHDAIARRRRRELSFQGRIDVRLDPEAGTMSFADDGIGLSAVEAEDYLGTLGIGITGLIKRGQPLPQGAVGGDRSDLIGQFGVGLFSAFMLADRLTVESRREEDAEGIRWSAGAGTEIDLASCVRETPGTTVTLQLKPEYIGLTKDPETIEKAIREYADFLPIPIYLNHGSSRVNVINVAWFDPSPDAESLELALAEYFDESPLDVIPVRVEHPASLAGALYVTPQRVPGFSDLATVMVTVRRMVISRRIQGLLPDWASFLRGCLELHDCSPTASREDLVRNDQFNRVRNTLEILLYEHFEQLADEDPNRMEALINWHRYTFAGAALENRRLRELLRRCYRLPTSQGQLTIDEVLSRSAADPLFEEEAEQVVWYNTDRRQERWVNQLFSGHSAPCVHTFRSFEESLLARIIADDLEAGITCDLRIASPSAPNFATAILGVHDLEEADTEWAEYLRSTESQILVGSFQAKQPVLAFLNERYELARSFEDLRQRGDIPSGFQRLIDSHFRDAPATQNEVILNRNHPLVQRALSQRPGTPLSSVLRLLVINALNSAGASVSAPARETQQEDLDWIAECLWGRDE